MQNWYVVPADVNTLMAFMKKGLEEEGWEITVDQNTDAKLYGTKGSRQVVTIHGYESDQYPDYGSEIMIEWIPRDRMG